MATLRQAVERVRNDGRLPVAGSVSTLDLDNRFHPNPRGSTRDLLNKMYDKATRRPWAIILCRFKGEYPDPAREGPIEQFFRRAFTPGTGGLVEYWRDVSLGSIDVSGSRVFNWVEVDLPRSKANTGSGATRSTLFDAAIKAVGNAAVAGFYDQLSVYTENWSINGVPPGLDWRDPVWGSYWIDGGTDGRGKVSLTPSYNGNVVAHEMGHGFGMDHDVGPDLRSDYQDPCCIMSQQHSFVPPAWSEPFGPALCLTHLVVNGWMYPRRLYVDNGGWMAQPGGISLPLAAIADPGAAANLGIKLAFSRSPNTKWDYFVEYMTPTFWNQGLNGPTVFIRRTVPYISGRTTSAYLGSIPVPATTGVTAQFIEPAGNVRFTVSPFDREGRIVKVGAIRL